MPDARTPHGLTEDSVIAMSDAQLIEQVYQCVGRVPADELETHDALYRVIGEAFERFVPELEWANVVEHHRRGDPQDAETEIEASRRAFRRRQGARLLKQALGGCDA